jgi:hypothetical protein
VANVTRYEYRLVQTGRFTHRGYKAYDRPLHFVFTTLVALRDRIDYVLPGRFGAPRVKCRPKVQRREIGPWQDWKEMADV